MKLTGALSEFLERRNSQKTTIGRSSNANKQKHATRRNGKTNEEQTTGKERLTGDNTKSVVPYATTNLKMQRPVFVNKRPRVSGTVSHPVLHRENKSGLEATHLVFGCIWSFHTTRSQAQPVVIEPLAA